MKCDTATITIESNCYEQIKEDSCIEIIRYCIDLNNVREWESVKFNYRKVLQMSSGAYKYFCFMDQLRKKNTEYK